VQSFAAFPKPYAASAKSRQRTARAVDSLFVKDGASDDRVVWSGSDQKKAEKARDDLNRINYRRKGPQGGGRYWIDTQEGDD